MAESRIAGEKHDSSLGYGVHHWQMPVMSQGSVDTNKHDDATLALVRLSSIRRKWSLHAVMP